MTDGTEIVDQYYLCDGWIIRCLKDSCFPYPGTAIRFKESTDPILNLPIDYSKFLTIHHQWSEGVFGDMSLNECIKKLFYYSLNS